ncbi:putative cytochrome c oxidase polypeptide 4 [Angustibacter aerolatus]|uniref:Cytochrome c oxidase polypeptide 4 n=1 Tax=Angustibacter aerolatus TaxID=1162965 RepID=A0ABQ6JMR5_9ACTN|nr:cytochrome c oxidase subunit 4 [Angustibacter aerolatus]GMA89077.1 putative cytochrome c oxidase polypeptide 4 [Angustibacter aerolatus]
MKAESWLFGAGVFFFVPVGIVYGFLTHWTEEVGPTGLFLTGLLALMVGWYLRFTARHIDPRPEDDPTAPVEAAAGEYGFFSPHRWWPLPLALSGAVVFTGMAVGWWLSLLGVGLGALALVGWVFEYWRGAHAH